ncbi:MAG: PPC domain-containing protein [Anaerolineae bacterium]|nr:PPC domain-containing protein [Anaerolineae bacterium]
MNLTKTRMRLLAIIAVVILAALPVVAVVAQEDGRQLTPAEPVSGTLDAEVYAQTYWFEGAAGESITLLVSTDAPDLALAMLLTDADGLLLAQDSDPAEAGEDAAAITDFALPGAGRYYVTVMRLSGAEGDAAGEFSLALALEDGDESPAMADRVIGPPTLVTLNSGIQVAVSWDSTADLDLEVRDPYGNSIFWDNPTAENAVFDRNVNASCVDPTAESPTEQINWAPGAVPSGSYEVIVYYMQGCDNNNPANIELNVTVDGVPLTSVAGTLLPDQEFLSSFVLSAAGEAEQGLSGIYPGSALRSPMSFLSGQTPLTTDTGLSGVIDAAQPHQAFSFTGSTGDIVSVRMDATSGNLDTALYLLDPNGNVVAYNDDALANTTNSEIANQTLVSDGLYTVVASRYGQEFGGTQGNFTITLTGAEFSVPPALAGLELPAGSIEISLLWNTGADLQLLVRDPSGNAVYDDIPFGNSGGVLEEDGNVNCVETTTSPVSYIYWPPDRLPPGTYEIEVWYQNQCNDASPVTFNLTARVNGQVIIASTAQPNPGQIYLTNFTVDVNGFASAGGGGFIGDSSMLDLGEALNSAIPVSYGDTVSGTINQTSKFVLYTFEGEAGDQIRVGMDATAGTLDTTLFLLSPDGAQLAANDDAVVNETTNSLIDDFTLAADGTYIIVATHYGLLYGGTSGTYNLSVVRLN